MIMRRLMQLTTVDVSCKNNKNNTSSGCNVVPLIATDKDHHYLSGKCARITSLRRRYMLPIRSSMCVFFSFFFLMSIFELYIV